MNLLAKFFAWEPIANWLIKRAMRTPYSHIGSADGSDIYMYRWWLFNPAGRDKPAKWPWLPSIRIHRIMRRDMDRHLHDHPWDARTFILRGFYEEVREDCFLRNLSAGETSKISFGEYHRIVYVPPGGVWTMFVTFRYQGTWGFLVDGVKVKWREYLNIPEDGTNA